VTLVNKENFSTFEEFYDVIKRKGRSMLAWTVIFTNSNAFNCGCNTDTSFSLYYILTYFKTDVANIFVNIVNSEVIKLCMPSIKAELWPYYNTEMFSVAPPLHYRWCTKRQFTFALRRKNIENDVIIASWFKMVHWNIKVNAGRKTNVRIGYKCNDKI
jgi:hypothetical protein